MAAASGLTLLQEAERNPLHTTTFGTGELLTAALQTGVVGIILGIGGSATVDLGAGCLQALGVRFLDAMGNALPAGLAGGALTQVASVDAWGLDPRWKATELMVACDVDNPLLGANGAAAVYGPQKGAKAKREIELLEWNLAHLAKVFRHRFGQDVSPMEGAGAAGGLGAGLCAVCGARLKKGCEVVAAAVALPQRLQGAGLVITGEGRLDAQTKYGKVVAGVAALANRLDVPCVAIVGTVDAKGADVMPRLARCESLFDEPVDLQMARHKTPQLLADAAQRLAAQWPA
jgi:glycerate kinase